MSNASKRVGFSANGGDVPKDRPVFRREGPHFLDFTSAICSGNFLGPPMYFLVVVGRASYQFCKIPLGVLRVSAVDDPFRCLGRRNGAYCVTIRFRLTTFGVHVVLGNVCDVSGSVMPFVGMFFHVIERYGSAKVSHYALIVGSAEST